jgi:peptidoglycan/LPS O-acetylase OafA/YrhL
VLFVVLLLLITLYFVVRSVGMLDWARRSRSLPGRESLLPLVALASVATVPFLTKELWNYIPSYARYCAPAAGMLVLLYAVSRDRAARFLMLALMVLTLTNPVVALLPISNQPSVQVPPPPP